MVYLISLVSPPFSFISYILFPDISGMMSSFTFFPVLSSNTSYSRIESNTKKIAIKI